MNAGANTSYHLFLPKLFRWIEAAGRPSGKHSKTVTVRQSPPRPRHLGTGSGLAGGTADRPVPAGTGAAQPTRHREVVPLGQMCTRVPSGKPVLCEPRIPSVGGL